MKHPEVSWPILKQVFYNHFSAARPNRAHEVIGAWEARSLLRCVVTQNVGNLHKHVGCSIN